MAIAMLFPITAFAQAYVQTWDLVDYGKHLDYDGNSTYMSYINTCLLYTSNEDKMDVNGCNRPPSYSLLVGQVHPRCKRCYE